MYTISNIKENLIGMGHGATLNKVRNIEAMFERAASIFKLKLHTIESMRTAPLTSTVHDDVYNYALPYDFGAFIDLSPSDERTAWDKAFRTPAGVFDLKKAMANRTISIEGSEGSKIIRINWRSRKGKVLNAMNSLTANGTWAAVATASTPVADTISKYSGSASIRFNVLASGDGIQNTGMTAVDLSDEDEVADNFVAIYLGSDYANLTSITPVWGNDVTTKFWTGVAITAQADGSPFKFGWNIIKAPWSTAVETGTVAPATIDSYKIIFTTTGTLTNVRVDNIIFSIGRNFDIKYYSKYLFKNSAGLWISKTTSDDDIVLIDTDTLPLFLYECFRQMAHQVEGSDSAFDLNEIVAQLKELYPAYKGMYPSQLKKSRSGYGGEKPARGRW